ncbi:MAG: class I SAM-dependent RNA methyltransferase [Pseudomonadota bacterium]
MNSAASVADRTQVVRLAARGDGVTAEGQFVAGALPGDHIVDGEIVAGPHHVAPPCRHFGVCGGCQLQHADEGVQRDFVAGRILATLATNGIVPETVRPTHLSPPFSRRRVAMRAERQGDDLVLGFNREGARTVVDLTECHVMTPGLFEIAQTLRPVLTALLPAGWVSGVTLTETRTGVDVLISNLSADARTISALSSWGRAVGAARISLETGGGVETAVQRTVPMVSFDGIDVELPPGAFLQATADGEAVLAAAVGEIIGDANTVADLFAGLGTFALPLAKGRQVFAADGAGAPIAALARAGATRHVTAAHRDLFRRPLSAKELARFDAVVIDPPRAGAKAQIDEIANSSLDLLAYVSCNPNTFARDAKVLAAAGFRLTDLWPVGQFRWSVHVELAARFVR